MTNSGFARDSSGNRHGKRDDRHADGDERHGKRDIQVATDRRTDRPTDVPLLRNGAAAPSRNERGDAQAAVIARYVTAATEAGVPIAIERDPDGRRVRGILAGQTGILLDDGWPLDAILRAVDRFARRRRFAGHLAQWVRENCADERTTEHVARMNDDRRTAKDTMRSIGRAMREIGL